MGFDCYCILCGCPSYNRQIVTDRRLLRGTTVNYENGTRFPEYDWLDDWLTLTWDGDALRGNGDDAINMGGYLLSSFRACGVGVHQACRTLVQRATGVSLTFFHFNVDAIEANNTYGGVNYGTVQRYMAQYFEFDAAWHHHRFLLESPLANAANGKRVLAVFRKCKIRAGVRPSPSASATLFRDDARRTGNDGGLWVVKDRRWTPLTAERERMEISCGAKDERDLVEAFNRLRQNKNRSFIAVAYAAGKVTLTLSGRSLARTLPTLPKAFTVRIL